MVIGPVNVSVQSSCKMAREKQPRKPKPLESQRLGFVGAACVDASLGIAAADRRARMVERAERAMTRIVEG